jgi:hypothetical protein
VRGGESDCIVNSSGERGGREMKKEKRNNKSLQKYV